VHLDIEEFGHRFPAQLSGGQQQRLAIARTIALEPNLLLLDEPLSNLDTKLRNEMRIEIKNMHRQLGLTTIYVTHDQSEAMSLSDVVVVMRAGRIEQVGTPQAIYDCPNSLYVADFMGYSNRLPVQIVERDGDEWRVQTETGVTLRATSTYAGSANWQPGERVVAVSRPDELLAEPLPDTNQMRGTVHLVDFVGKAYEILVRLEGKEETQLLVWGQHPIELERPLSFGIRPNRLLLFPMDDTPPAVRVKTRYREPAWQ
jgi:ABC-type Fe3+/spermidine/putrescine transport system ATPase subunit